MFENQNIVCFSNYYWGPLKQRYEHIMLELSRSNRVLFFELDADFVRQAKRNLLFSWLRGPRKISDNFFVVSPPPSLPFKYTIPYFNKISQNLNAVFYRKIIRKMGFSDFILWVTRPVHSELAGKLGEKFAVYDCVDDHTGFHLINQKNLVDLQVKNVIKMEEELLRKAQVVFTSSQELCSAKKKYNKNVFFVPNACDINHFGKTLLSETEVSGRIKSIKKPVIGFIGLLDRSRLNLDLIKKIAFSCPEYSLVLIGPDYLYGEKFSKYKNIHFLGEINYEEIPNYLKAIDVAILPYRSNELVRNISPVKLYEYLAAGRPVVCMDSAETKGLEKVIKIARDENEFVDLIEVCLKENSSELIRQRVESIKDNTWEKRVKVISEKLERQIKDQNPNFKMKEIP